jgi:hypothetical protein
MNLIGYEPIPPSVMLPSLSSYLISCIFVPLLFLNKIEPVVTPVIFNDISPPNTSNLLAGAVVPIPIDEPDSKIGVAVFAIVLALLNLTI